MHSIRINATANVPRILSSETSETYAGTATVNAPPQKPVRNRPVYKTARFGANAIMAQPMVKGNEIANIVLRLPILAIRNPDTGADKSAPSCNRLEIDVLLFQIIVNSNCFPPNNCVTNLPMPLWQPNCHFQYLGTLLETLYLLALAHWMLKHFLSRRLQ